MFGSQPLCPLLRFWGALNGLPGPATRAAAWITAGSPLAACESQTTPASPPVLIEAALFQALVPVADSCAGASQVGPDACATEAKPAKRERTAAPQAAHALVFKRPCPKPPETVPLFCAQM